MVKVPPGGETSVHTHPGPEFIYQLSGGIDCQGYQNDIFGMLQITNGDIEGIPPTTSVQNRNPSGGTVAFLSWFLVDLSQPFASPAFSHDTGLGINLASLRNGVSVAAVSSNFGEGGIYSTFGAADAIDWDPPTEWSSASDGDTAWIDVELASETNNIGGFLDPDHGRHRLGEPVPSDYRPRRDIRPVHRQRRHDHLPVRHPVHRQATSFRAAGLLKRQHRRVGD